MSSILRAIGTKVKEKLDAKLDKSGGVMTGDLSLSSPLKLSAYQSSNLPNPGIERRVIYVSDLGCIAVDDGSSWRKVDLGANL